MNELLFQQQQYAKTLMVELQNSFKLAGMSTLVDTIFVVCVAIGLFQCFKEAGSSSMGKSIIRFGLRLWMALALVYGGKYIGQMPMLKQMVGSSGPLSITLYYKINDLSTTYADKLSNNGADDAVLNYHTVNLMNTQDNILLAITKCESAEMNCLKSYLYTGNPPDMKPSDDSEIKESESIGTKIVNAVTENAEWIKSANAVLGFLSEISTFGTRFINNPGIILFPIMVWLLSLVSSALTVALNIVWALIIGVSMIMLPIVTPFMIIRGFESNIKNLYKTFFSTAFFGFAVKLVVLISTIMMDALAESTKDLLIPTVLQMASSAMGNEEIISDIRGFLLTNFILSFAIICVQIVGLTKVPTISRAIMFTSIDSLVNIGEVLFSAGLGYAKIAGKMAAVATATVVSGGVAGAMAVGSTVAAKAGTMAMAKGAGMLAKAGVSKVAGSTIGSAISKTTSALGKGVSSKGSILGNKIKNLSSNKLVNKIGSGIEQKAQSAENSITQKGADLKYKAQSLGEKAQKKLEQKSIFKKDLDLDSDNKKNKKNKDEGFSNSLLEFTKNDNQDDDKSNSMVNKMKNSVMGRFVNRVGSKINPLEIADKLYDSAFDITKMGAESVVKSELSGDGLDIFKYGMSTLGDIDYTGSKTPDQGNNSNKNATQNKTALPKPMDDADKYEFANNLTNADKKDFNDEQKIQFDDLQKKVMLGGASESELKDFKDLAENYNLSSDQLEEYNKTKLNVPELNYRDQKFDELISNYGVNDERMELIKNKVDNKELTKNDLQSGILKTKMTEYQNSKKEQIASKIKNEYDSYFTGKKNKDSVDKEYLKKTYMNKDLVSNLDKDTSEKLSKMIEIIKKK